MESLSHTPQLVSALSRGFLLFWCLHVLGVLCFAYIVYRRLIPLTRAQRDFRFDHPLFRLKNVLKYWFGQWKHPRYKTAGILHILIFAGFIILVLRAFTVLIIGVKYDFVMPGLSGGVGRLYELATDYAATIVFLCMFFAIVRRTVFKPARYEVPAKFGKAHKADAIFLLALIAVLMLADSLFEATRAAAFLQTQNAGSRAYLSLPWLLQAFLVQASSASIAAFCFAGYLLHELAFYFLLCYRPFGIQFHIETSLFNIYFSKLDREKLKPVQWGLSDQQLDQVKSFGVKTFEDFTWKHMLDFYSCADCGRCSDNCPSHAAGRPLSPRFLTIKARDYAFRHYPMFGKAGNGQALVGGIYSEDEIWSCTTCGACEAECPLLIEYVDKIVDLRRGLIDDGNVPQSLQKPLRALESRGNPYGKLEKKKADWTLAEDFHCRVKRLDKAFSANTLYFVDSITSYDDRMQSIARSTARILDFVEEDFGILGPAERDSGHDVRRFGEEMLFIALRDHNIEAITTAGVNRIVTADPHAFNALKRDYSGLPPVEHISQFIARKIRAGQLDFKPVDHSKIFTFHDPCYLGRHNDVYDDPRAVLDAIPGLKRLEMKRSRDRSFCCGGGGLMLFYEPKEQERMGVKRVRMAAEAGANVIVTACPFCMANLEDAVKVAGLESRMSVIDLAELVDQQIAGPALPNLERIQKIAQEYVMGR
jgi:Fe-S oxidoreductase